MNKFRKFSAFLMILAIFNSSLHASIFGEENATLTAILTEEIIQVTQIAETISQLKAIVDAGNQTINLARERYRQFQNYFFSDPSALSIKGIPAPFGLVGMTMKVVFFEFTSFL